jgi:O-antigen ligase
MLPRRVTMWSLAVTAACLPLYVVRWRMGPVPTTLLEVLILVTVAAYVVTLWTEKRLPAARTPYDIPIGLLLIAGLIGIAVAPDRLRAAGIYRSYFIEAVAVFYVAVDMVRTRGDVRTVLAGWGTGSCVMAIGQIISVTYALAHHQLHLGDAPSFLNTSANAVAMYLEPPLAIALAFTVHPVERRQRWIGGSVLGLLLLGLILTLSRAAYLAAGVLTAVYLLRLSSRRLRTWSLAGLVAVSLLFLEVPFIGARVFGFTSSVLLRYSIFTQALRMLSERPLFGAGISGFPIRVAPFRPATQTVELYPHNIWLTTWSELGLLGLIAFAVIFFGLLWRGVKALPAANDVWRPLLWGCVGALVLYLVHGLFDSPYWKNDLSVEFWLLAALQVVAIRGARGTPSGGQRRPSP